MDTQLFNQSPNTPGNKKNGKGGMSTGAKAGLGAAAGVAVGAGVAVAANHIANQPAEDPNPKEENREQNPEEVQKADGNEAPKAQDAPKPARHEDRPHTNEVHRQPQHHEEPKHTDDVNNRGGNDDVRQTENTETHEGHHTDTPVKPEDNTVTTTDDTTVTPNNPVDINAPINPDENVPDIAQVEIDEHDFDGTPMLEFDDVTTVYGVDGSEINMAHVVAEDGSDFVTVDIDGNGIFDGVATTDGIEYVEGIGSMGDAQVDIDPDGGYIAANTEEPDLPEDFGDDIFEA